MIFRCLPGENPGPGCLFILRWESLDQCSSCLPQWNANLYLPRTESCTWSLVTVTGNTERWDFRLQCCSAGWCQWLSAHIICRPARETRALCTAGSACERWGYRCVDISCLVESGQLIPPVTARSAGQPHKQLGSLVWWTLTIQVDPYDALLHGRQSNS